MREFLLGLFGNPALKILEVSMTHYIEAIEAIDKYHADPNDISAYLLMKQHNIKDIYTFDKHFKKFVDINCLP